MLNARVRTEQPGEQVPFAVWRGLVSRVLYDNTRDDVEYVFGDRIAELAHDADGVDVAFASRI